MNYIEYMSGGGNVDSTYVKYIPLQTVGPKSSLTLKRNNWLKAIKDAIVQNQTNNAQNTSVATPSSESNNGNNLPFVNTSAGRPGQYLSALAGLAGSGMYNIISHKQRS